MTYKITKMRELLIAMRKAKQKKQRKAELTRLKTGLLMAKAKARVSTTR